MRVRGEPVEGETTEVGDGITVPTEIRITADLDLGTAELVARYNHGSGRYAVTQVTVTGADGVEVTGEKLRAVPVAKILRTGLLHAIQAVMLVAFGARPYDAGHGGPTDETLRWLARIYHLAVMIGDAPTLAVAAALEIPRSTAGRWVTRARDRGYLTTADRSEDRGG